MSENKLFSVMYIKGDLRLLSPILIGNGSSTNADIDILRDAEGQPFIPGTSIAGVIRNYVEENLQIKSIQGIDGFFGKKVKFDDSSTNSCIYFYDLFLKSYKEKDLSVRDGIQINEYIKTTKNKSKYDYEVLNQGNCFEFKIEIIVREKYKEYYNTFKDIVSFIIQELNNGCIRIGAKTRRGLGKVILENVNVYNIYFAKNKAKEAYLKFKWNKAYEDEFSELGKEILKSNVNKEKLFTYITVPLEVKDTLFIRNYLLRNDDVDAEQIQYNNNFVIPGTTWSGAIRHKVNSILRELKASNAKNLVEQLFGYIDNDSDKKFKNNGRASRIYIDESYDESTSTFINITRNRIDRFTGGACDKGLFEERIAVGGNVTLNIAIKKAEDYEIGMILLVVYDLLNGLLAIGGETAVGRGVFSAAGFGSFKKEAIKINGINLLEDEIYLKDLAAKISKIS